MATLKRPGRLNFQLRLAFASKSSHVTDRTLIRSQSSMATRAPPRIIHDTRASKSSASTTNLKARKDEDMRSSSKRFRIRSSTTASFGFQSLGQLVLIRRTDLKAFLKT